MTDFGAHAERAGDTCYRHPNRQSFILCQRCGRTICADCQTQAPVGVHCPECMKEARASQPRVRRALSSATPLVTYTLIGINVVVFLQQQFLPPLTGWLWFAPAYVMTDLAFEPWRMITSMFLHGGILHLLFNMYALFLFGRILEAGFGRARYIALYLISGFGGSVAVLLLGDPMTPVVGASGAIFGLMGAYFVIQRQLGGDVRGLLVLLVINIAILFVPGSNISWQAHLGGLVIGAVVGLILGRTRRREQTRQQYLSLAAVAMALALITAVAGFIL